MDVKSVDTPLEGDPRKVMVVHGRNESARRALFTFLRALGLSPIEWSQAVRATGTASPYIGDVLDKAFAQARAVVVLMTPDDEARLCEELWKKDEPAYEKELTPQARPNVLFEAGMAFGRHPSRTILVELGKLRSFSDIGGRHVIRMNNTIAKRLELAERLRTAGCEVDTVGQDWEKAGRFVLRPKKTATPPRRKLSLEGPDRQKLEKLKQQASKVTRWLTGPRIYDDYQQGNDEYREFRTLADSLMQHQELKQAIEEFYSRVDVIFEVLDDQRTRWELTQAREELKEAYRSLALFS